MAKTKFIVNPDGSFQADQDGQGNSCTKEMAQLLEQLKALGIEVDTEAIRMKPQSGAVASVQEVEGK